MILQEQATFRQFEVWFSRCANEIMGKTAITQQKQAFWAELSLAFVGSSKISDQWGDLAE